MARLDTKERILDAAEQLFAERGFARTSLRTITNEAGVNLAAVHYHFGSKDALFRAVFGRRIEPVNRERLRQLERLEAEAGQHPVSVEALLEAFLGPVMRLQRDLGGRRGVWSRFIGRVYSEPIDLVQTMIRDQFADIGRRFIAALHRTLPHLPPAAIYQRVQFTVGTMTHILTALDQIHVVEEWSPKAVDSEATLRHLVTFLACGFRAPLPGNEASTDPPAAKAEAS